MSGRRRTAPGTSVEREQALWEWAKEQQDPSTLARIAAARTQCRVATSGANYQEKPAEPEQFVKTCRRPPSPEAKDRHERSLATWARATVASKSCLAREIELIYRAHRADQHHAQRIAAGRLNGLVAFIATTGRAPGVASPHEREVTLSKWAVEYFKNPERTCAAQRSKVLATVGQRQARCLPEGAPGPPLTGDERRPTATS
ncbi:hypothetical protein GCM10009696_12400 [Kocuria himachalensis]